MRVAIVGSREYPKMVYVPQYVRRHVNAADTLVSGGARGVDIQAEHAARARGIEVVSYRPVQQGERFRIVKVTFSREGKEETELPDGTYPSYAAAAYARNGLIANEGERIVAFWDGESKGTEDTIKKAKRLGRHVEICDKEGKVSRFLGEDRILQGKELRDELESLFSKEAA